uniref:Uncharacterized protein n=1 Tax=Oryza barthii TaxID=65489 RepID=A0A0D3G5D3_9ORYZ
MAKNSDNNQLILDGRIGLVSSLCQVEPILRNPERVFCAGQSSQSTSHVPDVYAGDFISTFHLPSRRTIRRRLRFASDNVPIPTGDGLSSGSPTLRAVETVCGLPHPPRCVAAESRKKRKVAMICRREERLYADTLSLSSRSVRRRKIPNDNIVHQPHHTQLRQHNPTSAAQPGGDGT